MKLLEKRIYKVLIIIVIIVIISVLCYFFYPTPLNSIAADGGTKIWKARMYTLVHWQEMDHSISLEDGTVLRWSGRKGWEIYWYPNQEAYQKVEPMNMEDFPWDEYNKWLEKQKSKEETE